MSRFDADQEFQKKVQPKQCKICNKVLSSLSSYYVHLKSHSGNKPYQCTECEASFCRKPYLEVHMRTHTGERPFKCETCDKAFTQKSSLNTHNRVHTGLRPYACSQCDKKFAVKSYLVSHLWSHISQGMPCRQCGLVIYSKPLFIQHASEHKNGAMFACTICCKVFTKASFLIRHQYRIHKNNVERIKQEEIF